MDPLVDYFVILTGGVKSLEITSVVNPEHPTCISVHVNSDPTPSPFTVVPFSSVANKNAGVIAQMPHGVAHLDVLDVKNVLICVPWFIPSDFHGNRMGYAFRNDGSHGRGYYLSQLDVNITETLNNSKPAIDDVGFLQLATPTERIQKLVVSKNLALDNMDSRVYTSRRIVNFQSVSVLANNTLALAVQGSDHTEKQKENHSDVSRRLLEGMDSMCRFGNVCNSEFTEFARIFGPTTTTATAASGPTTATTAVASGPTTTSAAAASVVSTMTSSATSAKSVATTTMTAASVLSSGAASATPSARGKRKQEQQVVHGASQSPPDKKGKI